jgi:hypothetical protein
MTVVNLELYPMIVIQRSVVWPVNKKLLEILLRYCYEIENNFKFLTLMSFCIMLWYCLYDPCPDNMRVFKLGNLYCLINLLSWDYSPFSSEVLPLVITKIREIPYTLSTLEVMTHTNNGDIESKPSYEKISDSWTLKLLYQTILQSVYCLMWIVGFAFIIKVNMDTSKKNPLQKGMDDVEQFEKYEIDNVLKLLFTFIVYLIYIEY